MEKLKNPKVIAAIVAVILGIAGALVVEVDQVVDEICAQRAEK